MRFRKLNVGQEQSKSILIDSTESDHMVGIRSSNTCEDYKA